MLISVYPARIHYVDGARPPASRSFLTLTLTSAQDGHDLRGGTDVSEVHGVFGGWTASDIVAPVQAHYRP